jgi:hypothetical protein
MKIYIFICGRNINVYGSGNMCAHEKWLNIVAKKEPFRTYEGIFWLRGNFFFSKPSSICVYWWPQSFKKVVGEREAFDTIVAYNSSTKTT